MEKGTVFGILTWVVIIGLFILVPKSCDKVAKTRADTKKQRAENEFVEFCTTNDATPAFKGLADHDLLTIDLQRSLFVNQKRVAFRAQLSDLYRSEKRGAMMAYFVVSDGGADVRVYLKCTDDLANQLHDEYTKNKSATFLVAAQFDDIERDLAESGAKTDAEYEYDYRAIGTLLSVKKGENPIDRVVTTSDSEE